jgi:hypothetical protein
VRRSLADDVMGKKQPEVDVLAQLQEMLGSAIGLARELAGDDLFGRMIAVFQKMPMEDRSIIIGVLEREVTGRLLARATEKPVGQSTHVNPNARLYVRAHSTAIDPRMFDRDEMMIADVRAMRIAGLIRHVPEIYTLWKEALREATGHVDEPELANAEQLLRDGLEAIDEARAAARAEQPSSGPVDAPARKQRP